MADTNTTNYGFTKPEVGGSDTTWGTKLNADLDAIDAQLKTLAAAQSAAALLTAIKTVDGNTSGLDADLLGGVANAKIFRHGGSETSATLRHGTAAASGGSDGDIYLQYA